MNMLETPQISLPIDVSDEMTFENFFAVKNSQAMLTLKNLANGRGERMVYLWGNKESGKTHLLQASINAASQKKLSAFYLPLANEKNLQPTIFENLETMYLICVDDIEKIAGKKEWEEAFFDLYNRVYDLGRKLVISGNRPPSQINFILPDLQSRLTSCITFQLYDLTDAEKISAIKFRAQQLGILLTDAMLNFIITRCSRDFNSLVEILKKLADASLKLQRRVTVPFIKEILSL